MLVCVLEHVNALEALRNACINLLLTYLLTCTYTYYMLHFLCLQGAL